jgi:hypothetical protein
MQVVIRCHKCKQALRIFTNIQSLDDIVIDVYPCDNLECRAIAVLVKKIAKEKIVPDERYPQKKNPV